MDKRKEAGELVFISKYARTKDDGTKETWSEAVSRVMQMHHGKIYDSLSPEKQKTFNGMFNEIWSAYDQQLILGAQRALQYGGEQLLDKHCRMYNCSGSYCDRVEFFSQLFHVLLCGAGVGYSVQKRHVSKIPKVKGCNTKYKITHVIPDSIEGWADSLAMLLNSYFDGTDKVIFDYSLIRPKGAYISGGFAAPGHEPLKKALERIENEVLKPSSGRNLKPIEAHKLCCLLADAVISGGIRRSALLCLFDAFDEDMVNCKTAGWWERNPEFARANNSAVILPSTKKEVYEELFEACKKFGEPGFAFLKDPDYMYNPCFEVSMFPKTNSGVSGFSFCNLTNVNVSKCKTKEELFNAVRLSAYLGTIQASYTDFDYLGATTKEIVERDSLIGVGLTGMCDNPKLIFDAEVQREAAEIAKKANMEMAEILGINFAARCCVVKP